MSFTLAEMVLKKALGFYNLKDGENKNAYKFH